jgi:membrane protease YdiL (CAAX protease family)
MPDAENENSMPQAPTETSRVTPVAPVWHTIVLLVVLIGIAVAQGFPRLSNPAMQPNRLAIYIATMVYELFLLGYVWLVAVLKYRVPLRELIGGKWRRPLDFFKDVGVAFLFWLAVIGLLLFARFALGFSGAAAARGMLPVTVPELTAFLTLAILAGFCEEIVFRGYLLRQFTAWTGNAGAGVILQGILFGLAHGYQGWKGMLVISAYGAMFGILAVLRKSLRPGIMQHCTQDAATGLIAWLAVKRHMALPMIIRF